MKPPLPLVLPNKLHAVCLDTVPPCVYMNDTSHAGASLVEAINAAEGKAVAAYTFDAGPNACIFTRDLRCCSPNFTIIISPMASKTCPGRSFYHCIRGMLSDRYLEFVYSLGEIFRGEFSI